ncbi:uncharacterized protein LOC120532061 [Polypterus senegalus]|uniref:uncharacterized protein LOC120532061 n=1 Tax=Polypterus senegalus TaxID=55291 RepID=UPI00196664CD|nr:uncharacterized protein LOC120532061 [Polypterus senegalus]
MCYIVKDVGAEFPLAHSSPSSCTDTLSVSSASEQDAGPPAKRTQLSPDRATDAKELVKNILMKKPGGEKIMQEYWEKRTLSDCTRRQLINMLVAYMTEEQGRIPAKEIREKYALGIVTLFPSLKDPFSTKGYEHFYDTESGTGYLAWRLKTVQRKTLFQSKEVKENINGGPSSVREIIHPEEQLTGDSCREAVSFLTHCSDKVLIYEKMRKTFQYRQQLVHNPEKMTSVLSVFPKFLDTKGLVNQDFSLLFGSDTSSKLLEKWDTCFKFKIIKEARSLTGQMADLNILLKCAESTFDFEDHESS